MCIRARGIYRARHIDMTFGDNGDVGFKMFTERDNWSVYYAMTDDATADDISLQLVTDTDAPVSYTHLSKNCRSAPRVRGRNP